MDATTTYTRWFDELTSDDVSQVGGKNASLGEMIGALREQGVRVPGGFATTADAYRQFVDHNDLSDRMQEHLSALRDGDRPLEEVGKAIRRLVLRSEFPESLEQAIREAYDELCRRHDRDEMDVAARSSATAEDLPEASFAGQQETFLNVTGADEVLDACRKCYASLFTDRAIAYREEKGFEHLKIALSVGIQKMVRSDKAGSGVMFSIDTETGFPDVVVIDAAWGLGENVVGGAVNPDEYRVFKPLLGRARPDSDEPFQPIIEKQLGPKEKQMIYASGGSATTKNIDTPKDRRRQFVLNDDEILTLAHWATAIEEHYAKPMDMEWAKDGDSGELFVVQARPETVQSQRAAEALKTYRLNEQGDTLVEGLAIGQGIAAGKACVIRSVEEMDRFEDDAVLVTEMTDPDWVPIMKRAAGIVTDQGGRTSHAAIVSRELGLPATVGTSNATDRIDDGRDITLSCAEGEVARVYDGVLDYDEEEIDLESVPDTKTQIMMNIASPSAAFRWWRLPCHGIGLARMEFIVNNVIKIHPMALVHPDRVEDDEARQQIDELTRGYDDRTQYFVDHLSRGIAKIAAAQYPDRAIVRMSDFKTNEYADLIGGTAFEPEEENPMLGFRGASRYYSDRYREGFALECRAIARVRRDIGLDNVVVMIPFCRTPEEADRVLEVMAEEGLQRGEHGLEVYCMAEIPSNVTLAGEFAERFDGFSIGSNDLTQLTLGVDRDSELLGELFDERHEAVRQTIKQLITTAHNSDTKVGICGQAPSDYPDFAAFLVQANIDSISLNPDSIVHTIRRVAEMEQQMAKQVEQSLQRAGAS